MNLIKIKAKFTSPSMLLFIFFIFQLILWTNQPLPLLADSDSPLAKRVKPDTDLATDKIHGLSWLTEDIPLDALTATLQGRFQRKEWSLLGETEILPTDRDFSFQVPLKGKITEVNFTAIGPLGEVEHEKVQIYYPEWGVSKNNSNEPTSAKFATGLGVTFLSMTQNAKPDFSLQGLTLKSSYRSTLLPPNIDWQVGGFITALSIHNSPSDRSAHFAGFNFRAGYPLPLSDPLWSAAISLGGYFATTWVDPNTFGYSNVYGPQFFPSVRRKLGGEKAISGYLKISPVTDGFSVLSLGSRELAVGIAVEGFKIEKFPISYTLDAANLVLQLSGTKIQSTSTTIGANLNW